METLTSKSRFELGKIVVTRGVMDAMVEKQSFAAFVCRSMARHRRGDWGDNISSDDKFENELSLDQGFRLLSAYETRGLPRIWIITEADRSSTSVLFPGEY
jgi:hypothetical protein